MGIKVFTLEKINTDDDRYTHWAKNLQLYIEKNGVKICLEGSEIINLVRSLPDTIGNKY